jgi:hypothetical protein
MKEFILSRAEMLALMAAVNASLIPGIDNDRLIPDTQNEQRELALQGLEQLQQRGLLRVENNTHILNGDLGMMAIALTNPQLITFITRDTPGVGQQQFLHYRADPVNVELTMPTEDSYRLAAIPDAITALARIRQLLPVTFENDLLQVRQTLDQEAFFQVKTLAETEQLDKAAEILQRAGFAAEIARYFIQTLRHPELGGTISFVRVRDQEIIDGRDLALVQDEQIAWLIRQVTPGVSILSIETVNAAEYSTALLDTLNSLF